MSYRSGIGYDIHRLVKGRPLVLAGVHIPFDRGLMGHSDGDVISHAICDAILGAVGSKEDIGDLFPDTSEETLNMYSLDMLKKVVNMIAMDFSIVNIDINCICERPRLAPYREDMVLNIVQACQVDRECVSIKFRTNEGIDEIGRGDAIASQVVVLVRMRRHI